MSKIRVSYREDLARASKDTKEKFKKKPSKRPAELSDEQVSKTAKRIMGVMNWHCGLLVVSAKNHRQLACEILPKVKLASSMNATQATTLIEAAIRLLEQEGLIDFRPDDGLLMSRHAVSQKRRHRDKYANA